MQPVNTLPRRPSAPFARLGVAALSLAILCLLGSGCGGSGPKAGPVVSGKVTIGGSPPASGSMLVFIGDGNKEVSALILDDGAYTLVDAPVGNVQVIVRGGQGAGAPAPGGAGMPGMKGATGVPVPDKYAQPNNGLTYTVTKGNQTKNFELTP